MLSGLTAQEPVYWQLSDEDGLPSMVVYDILQDDLGYIWLGTENGLCRYDGQQITTLDGLHLKDQEIIDIEKDAWNRVWLANLSGQLAFVNEQQTIKVVEEDHLNGKIIPTFHIYQDRLWGFFSSPKSGTQIQEYLLSDDSSHQLSFKQKIQLNTKSLSLSAKQESAGLLSFNNDLIQLYPLDRNASPQVEQQFNYPAHKYYVHQSILDFCYHQDKQIFLLKDHTGAMNLMSIQKGVLRTWQTFEPNIEFTGLQVTKDRLWLLSKNGVWSGILDDQDSGPQLKLILSDINANNVLLDREGTYWIATSGQGVIAIPKLSVYNSNLNTHDRSAAEVFTIFADTLHRQVVYGHADGLLSFHHPQRTTKVIQLEKKGTVQDIYRAQGGDLYIATDAGVVILDAEGRTKNQFKFVGVKKIQIDHRNRLWFGTYNTTLSYPNPNISLKLRPDIILHDRTYALQETKDRSMWIGTINSLYYFQDSLHAFHPFGQQKIYVTDFVETEDSVLWVSTQSQGILAIKAQKTIAHYTQKDGLRSNNCKALTWDGQHLWIATDQGLNHFDPQTKTFGYLDRKDGIPSNNINDVAVLEDQIWAATYKGVVYFHKDIDHHNATPPLVYLTNFKVRDQSYPLQPTTHLSAKENNLVFEFSGLALKAKNAVTYKYRIQGIDSNWVHTNAPIARYPVINSGHYRFEVYAINEDQVASKEPASLVFDIALPWWQRWWAILSAVVMLGLSIAGLIRLQTKKLQQQRRIERKMDQLKQRALQTQMNPHFIFNAMGAIQNSLTTNNQEEAIIYLSRFAKLIRTIFEFSKRDHISLEEEIDFLQLYLNLEKLRFQNKVQIQFSVDQDLEPVLFQTFIPPLLLQPLIENAFKHGLFHKEEGGLVNIQFSRKGNYLYFSISDNGVGRQQVMELTDHIPSGIANIQDRLQIINPKRERTNFPPLTITDLKDNHQALGTLVEVHIYCKNFASS